jgi:hypothetical protein
MQSFTDRKFVEAVELLQATEAQYAKRDKRRAPRRDIRVPVLIKAGDDNLHIPWTTAQLRDVSPRGVLLAIDERVEIGSSLLLRLPTKEHEEPDTPLICRVAHCKKRSDDLFMIGVEFVGRVEPTPTSEESDAERERIQRSILG